MENLFVLGNISFIFEMKLYLNYYEAMFGRLFYDNYGGGESGVIN